MLKYLDTYTKINGNQDGIMINSEFKNGNQDLFIYMET